MANTYGQSWGTGDQKNKMIQIGNNRFHEHGDFSEFIKEKTAEAKQIQEVLDVQSGEIGVEIGSGTGVHALYFAQRSAFLHSFDVTDNFLETFQTVTAEATNIRRVRKDFMPVMDEIPDASIDYVYSTSVFCHLHVYDVYLYFEEISRVLKPGGRFFVNYQNADNVDFDDFYMLFLENYRRNGVFEPIHPAQMQFHSNAYFLSLARKFGLAVAHQKIVATYSELLFTRKTTDSESSSKLGDMISAPGWERQPTSYSFEEFERDFVLTRPDLEDVREFNHEMIDIHADLRPLKGTRLLDVGASPHGFALERARQIGVQDYYGVGLAMGKEIEVKSDAFSGYLLKMNAQSMDFKAESFDHIITLSTFEHFWDGAAALREMYRVLRPGGSLLLTFQPIWTSCEGHHLHYLPDVAAVIPPWAHLRWTASEMRENLKDKWPAEPSVTLDEAIRMVYDGDEINRRTIHEHRRILEGSEFHTEWLTPLVDESDPVTVELAEQLAVDSLYSREDLLTKGFSALMTKPLPAVSQSPRTI